MSGALSIRAYARHRGCNESSVRKAIKAGRISKDPDGRIDQAQADAQWTSNTVPSTGAELGKRRVAVSPEALSEVQKAVGRKSTGHDAVTLVDARLAKLIHEAEQARLKTEQMRSQLLEREQVERQMFARFRQVRDGWLSWPARMCAVMASDLGVDEADVLALLEQYVQQQLADLSSLELRGIDP